MGTKTVSVQTKQSGTPPVETGSIITMFDDFDSNGDVTVARSAEVSVSVSPTNFMWLGVKVFCSIEFRCRKDQFQDASRVAIAAAVAEVSDDSEWVASMWRKKSEEIKAALEAKWQKNGVS